MNKNKIQKYAIWARRELISRATQRAYLYGVREDGIEPESASLDGRLLTDAEISERRALVQQVKEKGFEQVMEEVAYTWFNRFCALRFMEVNEYLPVRVFTDEENNFRPQILTEAVNLAMDTIDTEKVYEMVNADRKEDLYKYLLVCQCNELNRSLPGMFQTINDYTELLFPDNLLREGSVIEQMVSMIDEEDWKDAIQIVGWLYQYYNSEPKDKVFADLKKNIKITKNTIPAATQLFTPDWIVRYMVENSLGRLWLEGHPNDDLRSGWKYYLDEAEQTPEVQAQLEEIRAEYRKLEPQDIKVIDPCMGSGHILAYMFDILMQIYLDYGYTKREAVRSILKNNLYGLDIDDRAGQLAYFAVMMKAQSYDRGFLRRTDNPTPHVYAIQESNYINRRHLDFMGGSMDELSKNNAKNQLTSLLDTLTDAKEYGSILNVETCDWALLRRFATDTTHEEEQYTLETTGIEETSNALLRLISIGETMAQKYDAVVTNPPYMGSSGMSAKLSDYVKKNYPDSKSDLFAVFIEKCGQMSKKNGYQAMITQHAWMFLSSFEKLRTKLKQKEIVNMAHLGPRAFEEIGGEVVQTTSFVLCNQHINGYKGTYCRLLEPTTQQGKENMFLAGKNRYTSTQDNFSKIPGSPVAYWVNASILTAYEQGNLIGDSADVKIGMGTGKNEIFVREWWEVVYTKIDFSLKTINDLAESKGRYFPYNKGGEFRLWFGNLQEVLWFDTEGRRYMDTMSGHRENGARDFYCKEGLTWSFISSSKFGIRYLPTGCFFDVAGSTLFSRVDNAYTLGFLASCVCFDILGILNPTLNYQAGNIKSLPLLIDREDEVDERVYQNIQISKEDWDSYENSWDFKRNPLVVGNSLSAAYAAWKQECEDRFNQLKANEEELNRIFIDIYGLQDELTPDVAEKDVTVHRVFDSKDDVPESMKGSNYVRTMRDEIVSLISYAVGCMLGRYSLDMDGLAYAGGEWDSSKYKTFPADKDNIIPICDDAYFEDDMANRFEKWVETVFGAATLEENLQFIADALDGRGDAREVIRNYFINDFYADHLKVYQKRPIYWLFDSGKKNGFKALIYMHRYDQDTLARLRTDYVHEQQERYRTVIDQIERNLVSADGGKRVKLNKQLAKVKAQLEEASVLEEKVTHLADQRIAIDLDKGVKHNYALFQDVLAKIK